MKTPVSVAILAMAFLSANASGQEMTQLSCKDFIPTQEARERFPDLAGACEGVVERDGELYGLFRVEVRRVRGNNVTLHLPATDHTFTVKPDPATRVMVDGRKVHATWPPGRKSEFTSRRASLRNPMSRRSPSSLNRIFSSTCLSMTSLPYPFRAA